jgi:hypothetical protein
VAARKGTLCPLGQGQKANRRTAARPAGRTRYRALATSHACRLVANGPNGLSLKILMALADILNCTMGISRAPLSKGRRAAGARPDAAPTGELARLARQLCDLGVVTRVILEAAAAAGRPFRPLQALRWSVAGAVRATGGWVLSTRVCLWAGDANVTG